VNGRDVSLKKFNLEEDLAEWIRLEIELAKEPSAKAREAAGR
jgi:hypothetical protein